jgi:lysophospholipase L1-like esterase
MSTDTIDHLSLWKKVLFSLIITAVFFLGLEAAIRVRDYVTERSDSIWRYTYNPPTSALYVDHPFLGAALKPLVRYDTGTYTITINDLGYRGKSFHREKQPGVYRIACLGASSTFGAEVPDDETYAVHMDSLLTARMPDRQFEVINAGIPGYTSAECLINFSMRVVDLKPDLVIIYLGYNDFKPNRHPGFASDYAHWRIPGERTTPTGFWADVSSVLERWSLFYYKLRWNLPEYLGKLQCPRVADRFPRYDTVSDEGVTTFTRNLESIISIARSNGIDVGLVTEALCISKADFEVNADWYTEVLNFVPTLTIDGLLHAKEQYSKAVHRLAESYDLPFMDSAVVVPVSSDYFKDHVHLNIKGHRTLAGGMAGMVESHLTNQPKD